jgi:aspartate racemase
MKHIGILAHSAEGSASAYLTACHEGERVLGPHEHPPITLDIAAMGPSLPDWEALRLAPIRARLLDSAARLQRAGADFFICPDNTAHLALEADGPRFPLPGLHIAEIVAAAARRDGRRKLAVLGTRWTMTSDLYPRALARQGMGWAVPLAGEMDAIQAAIFDELCQGVFTEPTRARFARVIERMAGEGCDGVVLGCTEIPLIVKPSEAALPTFDSTRLLATAAVAVALGRAPFPSWVQGRP